ncbi:uncharacterized protein C12orf76 homolog [Bombina bombina]|uniref:uncharacterized protein C12orf76 homolog n=1 Tax=Bombina bombina TaxID=8345 RepID=UPI00235ABA6D|nr:uncharacterized protein C12orf76 homolog [Bombina bombina]
MQVWKMEKGPGTCTPLLLVLLCLSVSGGEAQTDSTPEQSRPYAVLLKQNLVLLGSILTVLFVAMIVLAVCVYKPIRRR